MGKQCLGRQLDSPSAPIPLGHLTFVALRCFSRKTCEASGSRIERLFLPSELWKSKGTLSSSRALDCPPISRGTKGVCWLLGRRKREADRTIARQGPSVYAARDGQIRVKREDAENLASRRGAAHDS
ncbi:MAG: hypothetical protein IJU76_07030 [Desulfovibrionaceae bacterium]|nr:hypothetical protein [Desulfovibrionaceae bacterium]